MARKRYIETNPVAVSALRLLCKATGIPFDLALQALEHLARNNVPRRPDRRKLLNVDEHGIHWHNGNLGANEFLWLVQNGIEKIGIEEVTATTLKNTIVFVFRGKRVRVGRHFSSMRADETPLSEYQVSEMKREDVLAWLQPPSGKQVINYVYELFHRVHPRSGTIDDMLDQMFK